MDTGAGAGAPYASRTAEEVFRDFRGRRAGMIKALTHEVDKFYQLCDPEKENLCLYGFPNETWEVTLPAEEVPPEIPEPALGINFARDGMNDKDWLALVAVHSDSWLLAVSFYFAARFGFDKEARCEAYKRRSSGRAQTWGYREAVYDENREEARWWMSLATSTSAARRRSGGCRLTTRCGKSSATLAVALLPTRLPTPQFYFLFSVLLGYEWLKEWASKSIRIQCFAAIYLVLFMFPCCCTPVT